MFLELLHECFAEASGAFAFAAERIAAPTACAEFLMAVRGEELIADMYCRKEEETTEE
jgi:hypothetical protein